MPAPHDVIPTASYGVEPFKRKVRELEVAARLDPAAVPCAPTVVS